MLGIALAGTMLSGMYGILHDQITCSISPEYFTRLKFFQFHWANVGLPPRLFVGEIGFLATWWVGFFSAWFLARIAVPTWPTGLAVRRCLAGFSVILVFAFISGVIGYCLGIAHSSDFSDWQEMCMRLGVTDVPAFVRVAYIHNARYIGGLYRMPKLISEMGGTERKEAIILMKTKTEKTWRWGGGNSLVIGSRVLLI